MIFLLRNQLFGDICILNEGSALLPFSLSILTVQEPIITRGGKAACSFLYDIIREVRIEKGVFLYGSEEVSSLLARGYYINDCKFCYKSIKRFYRIPYQNIAGDIGFIFTNKFTRFMDFV